MFFVNKFATSDPFLKNQEKKMDKFFPKIFFGEFCYFFFSEEISKQFFFIIQEISFQNYFSKKLRGFSLPSTLQKRSSVEFLKRDLTIPVTLTEKIGSAKEFLVFTGFL